MDKDFEYRLFTVSELKDWLFHQSNNGLTDAVISRPRALAFVNNPHAQSDDPALVVVFDEKGESVGYTGAYAEQWIRPATVERFFWGSTQWMDAKYRGKGIAAKMMRQIKDAVNDRYIATESSAASCRLDEKQGSTILYYPRYFVVLRQDVNSFKTLVKNGLSLLSKKKALRHLEGFDYTNRYVTSIDDETYSFIAKHSGENLFLRKQDFLNWQMRFPFAVPVSEDDKNVVERCEFGGSVKRLKTQMVQVFAGGRLCGFYVMKVIDSLCSPWYLYYDSAFRDQVFASVATALLQLDNISKFQTFDKDMYDFLGRIGIQSQFSKSHVDQVSLTVPSDFEVNDSLHIQGGDGDMMV